MTVEPLALRAGNRRRVQQQVRDAALPLLLSQGFHETTVGQIAAVGGISQRTFFRLFRDKEDLVVPRRPDVPRRLAARLAEAPATGRPAEALDQVCEVLLAQQLGGVPDESARAVARVVSATPSLQARSALLALDLEPVVAGHLQRAGGLAPDRARLVAGALFGALRAARQLGADSGGDAAEHDPRELVRDAVDTVRLGLEPHGAG